MSYKQQLTKSKTGFTIIEVVLVLAIAGLIFLMVFVALPALQRSQRDTQRRQDYADLSANILNYMTNNGGNLPSAGTDLEESKFLNSKGKDPTGTDYTITVKKLASGNTAGAGVDALSEGKVYVYINANCSSTSTQSNNTKGYKVPTYDSRAKAYAIFGYLEGGAYCLASE